MDGYNVLGSNFHTTSKHAPKLSIPNMEGGLCKRTNFRPYVMLSERINLSHHLNEPLFTMSLMKTYCGADRRFKALV